MATIFTKIIKGELPCYKIHEDELTISFLALDQVHLGHTLVLPKAEISHWYEVPEKDYLQVAKNAQVIARAIKKSTECSRVGTIVAGFEVPHYHLHLIPSWSIADLSFAGAKRRSDQEMKDIQQKIISFLKF